MRSDSQSDAVAAIGIVKRQGLGRVRHLAVADLWVQQRAKGGEVSYAKLDGKRNTSDMMTKAVEKEVIMRHMQSLGLQFRSGRHEATPAFTGGEDGIPKDQQEEGKRRGGAQRGAREGSSKPKPKAKPSSTNPKYAGDNLSKKL